MNAGKKALGQFFTRGNPFRFAPFREWARVAGLPRATLLEPFAGAGHIVQTLREGGVCDAVYSFDIAPAHEEVAMRDCLADFPAGYTVTVTNPPWLARNSAARNGLPYPARRHDDLYKYCLELCLQHCDFAALLMPASYLQSGLFFERLQTYILLHETNFNDTESPACLALFTPQWSTQVGIYYDNTRIGTLAYMQSYLPVEKTNRRARFNDPKGVLGFVSFDNTKTPSIHFCHAEELDGHEIKHSSRFITRISGEFGGAGEINKLISNLNRAVATFRSNTWDVFLTPFKGMRSDGQYRRRMKYALARSFINAA